VGAGADEDEPGFAYDDVAVVRWPAQKDERESLATEGRPRVLLVPPDEDPPPAWDELEDWLREPPDAIELYVRRERLRRRVDARRPVTVDADGLVHRGPRWVAMSPTELVLVRLLVAHQGRVVPREDLLAALRPEAGTDGEPSAGKDDATRAVDTFIRRSRQRLEPLGVVIHNIRGAGFLLRAEGDSI
jgi:hypothetical protein